MPEIKFFAEVAIALPIRKTFIYEVPAAMQPLLSPGKRVLVSFRGRILAGFVLDLLSKPFPGKKNLPIHQILPDELAISEKLLSFLVWISKYYFQPIGEVLKAALPQGIQIRSRNNYFITEKGLQALNNLSPSSWDRKILQSLKRRGGESSLATFIKKDSASLKLLIERMIQEGLMGKKEGILEQKTKEKIETFVRFLTRKDGLPLSPGQKEVLDCLQKKGEMPLQEIKQSYKNWSPVLTKFMKYEMIEITKKETLRQPYGDEIEDWVDGPPCILSQEQKAVVEEISKALHSRKYQPFLLHGVTGSGKTEVYLQVIQAAIRQERQSLLLVPEIALTGQLVAYFRSRIDSPLAILHSGLSSGERYDEWRRIKKGLVQLVIGARSAIFAPLDRLGVLIVDEEHDPSYKQEGKIHYHARDLALVRGKMENAVVVLGTATPSMESYYNALKKKFHYLALPHRVDHRPLPEIQILDMRLEQKERKESMIFSRALEDALRENTQRGEQALLFLNRRGFSTFALCRDCGFVYRCPNCSVSLIYHLPGKNFRCHYCDYSLPALPHCPSCASTHLMLFGMGTQRLEEEIKKKFPGVRVGRMDRDSASRKTHQYRILNQVRHGEINLLVGTQMIAKGHDLPRVTLVGVLAADLSLNIPDFRASERTFQLLTQVAGRAGRGILPGKVIIQTHNPKHYSIQLAKAYDFQGFYQTEAKFRQEMTYPPFSRLINFQLEGNSETRVNQYARILGQRIREIQHREKFQSQVELLGPAMAPLTKLKGKWRCRLLLKGRKWSLLHDFVEEVLRKAEDKSVPGVKLIIDVDPVNML